MSSPAAMPGRLVCRYHQVWHGAHPENSGISCSGRSRNYKLRYGIGRFWPNFPVPRCAKGEVVGSRERQVRGAKGYYRNLLYFISLTGGSRLVVDRLAKFQNGIKTAAENGHSPVHE